MYSTTRLNFPLESELLENNLFDTSKSYIFPMQLGHEPVKKGDPFKNLKDITQERRRSFMHNESNLDKELHHWAEYKIEGKKISRRCYQSLVCYNS